MRFFDTHSHLNFPQFDADLSEVIGRAKKNGVKEIVVVGTNRETISKALKIAHQYCLWASVGIHPSDAEKERVEPRAFAEWLQNKRVVAIGETGLDYASPVNKQRQEELFRFLLEKAKGANLPAIIHSREATVQTLKILKEFAPIKGVWHCFSGDEKLAKEILDLGLFISFTANVTYQKNQHLRDVVNFIPLESLLLETDCPFLPPEGRRGQRNEPAFLVRLAWVVAEIKREPLLRVAEQTFKNGTVLFLASKKE